MRGNGIDIAELKKKAESEVAKETGPWIKDFMPVFAILREDKHMTWGEIRNWLKTNAGVVYSEAHLANSYKTFGHVRENPSRGGSGTSG